MLGSASSLWIGLSTHGEHRWVLADGAPRPRRAILDALAGRHARDDIKRTPMRLAVTGQLIETAGRYALAPPAGEED